MALRPRPGRRYSALVEFNGEPRIVGDIRAWDKAHAEKLLDGRRDRFFRFHQVPTFQQKTWRVLGIFWGNIHFAKE